ncbi:hypothetical protein PanWU01x14_040750, partial [Parasponia andersonii]
EVKSKMIYSMGKVVSTQAVQNVSTIKIINQQIIFESLLPIFLDNLVFLKNEFSFFVLLGLLISSFILPSQNFTTVLAVNISNCVETSYKLPVLFGAQNYVHGMGEQKGSPMHCLRQKYIRTFIFFDQPYYIHQITLFEFH